MPIEPKDYSLLINHLHVAMKLYIRRNSKERDEKMWPEGAFTLGRVWIPFPTEVEDCCKLLAVVKQDARNAFRTQLLQHCCSYVHISQKLHIDRTLLMRAVKIVEGDISKIDDFRTLVKLTALIAQWERKNSEKS